MQSWCCKYRSGSILLKNKKGTTPFKNYGCKSVLPVWPSHIAVGARNMSERKRGIYCIVGEEGVLPA
jgi:hypothetical protein